MKLVSVNIGRPRPVSHRGGIVSTGIYREPVIGPVWVRRLNLEGDGGWPAKQRLPVGDEAVQVDG